MAASAAARRIQYPALALAVTLEQAIEDPGSDQGTVHRQDEERLYVFPQRSHSRLDRGEHPQLPVWVADHPGPEPVEHRCEMFRAVPGHNEDVVDPRLGNRTDYPFDHRAGTERQKGLARAHARGSARRQNNGGYTGV